MIMCLTEREREMDRQPVGVHHRVYPAREASSRATHNQGHQANPLA